MCGGTTRAAMAGFLSTPSARRATSIHPPRIPRISDFYPRPPRGGRHGSHYGSGVQRNISIHALREEGDRTLHGCLSIGTNFYPRPPRGGRPAQRAAAACESYFYPRPPRGGRPPASSNSAHILRISIHALREEGDAVVIVQHLTADNFYPRPPRGGRRCQCRHHKTNHHISIHALREEGDNANPGKYVSIITFLSTPSARRATAKTERKPSAFVSLYTALHKLQRGAFKTNRKITPLLTQTAGIPVRSVQENHVRFLFALAGYQKISTLSCANSGCSPTCSTLVW